MHRRNDEGGEERRDSYADSPYATVLYRDLSFLPRETYDAAIVTLFLYRKGAVEYGAHVQQGWLGSWRGFANFWCRPSDLRREGNRLRDNGLWNEAARAYRYYLAKRPHDHGVRIQYGNMLKEAGRFQEADAAYARVQAENRDVEVLKMRGYLALRMDAPSRAADYFLQAWLENPTKTSASDLFEAACLPYVSDAFNRAGLDLPLGRIETGGGRMVVGWVRVFDSDEPCEVEFVQDDVMLGRVIVDIPRPEIEREGLARLNCGFAADVGSLDKVPNWDAPIEVRVARRGGDLIGSPFRIEIPDALQKWLLRSAPLPGKAAETPRLTFIMPVHNPEPSWLVEALSSVCSQDRGDWELVCIDDGSAPEVANILDEWRARDSRINLCRNEKSLGVSAATNRGLQAAKGEIVAFVDHDDRVEPEAARRIIEAFDLGADVVYSDELLTEENSSIVRSVELRGDFSHDYYLSHPYFVHLIAVRRSIAIEIGGLDENLNISTDIDFVLRVLERSKSVSHVPSLLYRWRVHGKSLGHAKKPLVMRETVSAIERHLRRLGLSAEVGEGASFNTYSIKWPKSKERTLAVMPTRDGIAFLSKAVGSVLKTTGDELDIVIVDNQSVKEETLSYFSNLPPRVKVVRHEGEFNFSAINNRAVRSCGDGYGRVLFLNNDIESTEKGWHERLAGLADRSDVGVVGASLMYPDWRVQHAGVVLGLGGPAEHVFKFAQLHPNSTQKNVGPGCAFAATRDVSAVTAACMMMRRSVFLEVGGFDEALVVGFNDTDLCLRVGAAGYKILNDGGCWLVHHESATRKVTNQVLHPDDAARFRSRWEASLQAGDPWYSPLASLDPSTLEHASLDREIPPRVSRVRLVGDRHV